MSTVRTWMASAYWFKVKLPWDVCQLQKRRHLRCVIWGSGLVFFLWTWINSKLCVSNEHPGSLATTQKGFNLLQGFLVWHEKTSLIRLQIVRDQISCSNHQAIWHNVTQNIPVNVCKQNVYALNCSSHVSPAIAACCILHPVFGCWSNPQMRKPKEVEWSRIKRMQLLWLFCNCLCEIWEVARLNQLMLPEVGLKVSFGLFNCLAIVQAKMCLFWCNIHSKGGKKMKKHSAGSSLANTACCLEVQRFTIYILHIILPHASLSFAQATSNFVRNTLRPHQVCRCVLQTINCQITNPSFSEQMHPTIWSPSSDLSQAAQDLLQSLGTSFLINSKLICVIWACGLFWSVW